MLNNLQRYRFSCTLKFGDIYGQVMAWLIVIFIGLAASIALYDNPISALLAGGLILVLSLPFLLFAFVTTLLNHIELTPLPVGAQVNSATAANSPSGVATAN
jgi:ABC-type dipeptide/oligopeptide/nickel transport system permease component